MPKMPRLTIGRMMLAVGVVAVNIALARLIYSPTTRLLTSVSLGILALQFAALRIAQGRSRPFWMGYLIFGAIALASLAGYVWAWPEWVTSAWSEYFRYVRQELRAYPSLPQIVPPSVSDTVGIHIITAIFVFLPQLIVAVAGGLLVVGLTRLASASKSLPETEPAQPTSDSPA